MSKKIIRFLVPSLVFLPIMVLAQTEGFKVAGEINFKKAGDLFVELVTEDEFAMDIQIEIPESFIVAGEITFKKTGNLFVQLLTEEEFKGKKETPFALTLTLTEKEIEAKKVPFAFYNVPPGRYGIRCFQDVNGNEKLDFGLFGPREPWGYYRPKRPRFRGPKFKEVVFEVSEDTIDIQFEVK